MAVSLVTRLLSVFTLSPGLLACYLLSLCLEPYLTFGCVSTVHFGLEFIGFVFPHVAPVDRSSHCLLPFVECQIIELLCSKFSKICPFHSEWKPNPYHWSIKLSNNISKVSATMFLTYSVPAHCSPGCSSNMPDMIQIQSLSAA